MQKEVLTKEIEGNEVSVDELDAIELADYTVFYYDLQDNYKAIGELKEGQNKEASILLAKNTKTLSEAFKIPTIFYCGEEVEDIAFFIKRIGLNESFKLYLEILNIGMLEEDELKK